MTERVYTLPCIGGHEVDVRSPGVLFEFTGWAERSRRGGGLHHFAFKEQTGRVMCADCASKRKRSGSVDQVELW